MKIYCHTPTKDDAPSMYRGYGALSELARDGIYAEFHGDIDLLRVKGFSALFMQRPDRETQAEVIAFAKSIKMPVVVDYDDNLLEVPPHNKNYYQYMAKNNPNFKECVKFALSEADVVIVSTEELKRQFSKYNNNITVIRNAFDDYIYTPKAFNKTKTVVWRGGESHTKDLREYQEELTALIINNPDFHFVFMGDGFPVWLLELKAPNITLKDPVWTYDFFNTLKGISASLLLVPLEDTLFNRCKSDCAKIEAIMAGALCVSPAWEEWAWCPYCYDGSMYKVAQALINRIRDYDPELIREHRAMQSYIMSNRTLSIANSRRLDVFQLLDKGRHPRGQALEGCPTQSSTRCPVFQC